MSTRDPSPTAGVSGSGRRWPVGAVAVAIALALVATFAFLRAQQPATSDAPDSAAADDPGAPEAAHTHPGPRPSLAAADPGAAPRADQPAPRADPAAPPAALTGNEYPVDLDLLRQRLPDNLYWRMSAPTRDPAELAARAADKQRWNQLYGKIQSGTGSEADIQRYFEHRRQVSADHLEFATLVLEEYGAVLPARDQGLYELSIRMHKSRLDELPAKIDEAMARKREQDERRAAWREEQ
ncbi:MAG: hypothetical protein Tsb0020_42990 [Haliangiales bacterium]